MTHILSATLELKDKFSSRIKTAGRELGNFTRETSKVRGAVNETTNSIKNSLGSLNKFAIAFGGFKIASATFNFIKDAYTSYAELDQVLTKNKAIMRSSVEETARLKEQVMELGKTMPFTAKEVAEAQKYQAMAGLKANEVLELTPKLLKLSIASGEDLARTSDIITDNMSAFGLELKDVDRLLDVMAITANNTNTSIGGLGEAYQYVAATSRNFDSVENVNVLLGILANNGIKSSKAGRNLAAIYARLAKATPDMEKAMKKVGLSLYDNNGKFKGLINIIRELQPKLARMTDEQRNYIVTTLAGTEGLKIFDSLLGTSSETFDDLIKKINNSAGAIEEIYSIQKDTPANKIKELASAWEAFKLKIAEAAAPAITGIIENLTSKINELADSDTFSKENVEAFFNSIKEGAKGAIDSIDAIMLALKPVIWGLKTIGWVGKTGNDIGSWIGEKIGRTKNKWELRKEYQDKGYTWDEANAQAEKDLETIDLKNSASEDDENLDYIKQKMLKEHIENSKGSGKGLQQLTKESEEDFKERRRLAKLNSDEIIKEEKINLERNKVLNSLNNQEIPGKRLPEMPKTELEKVNEKSGHNLVKSATAEILPVINLNRETNFKKDRILENNKNLNLKDNKLPKKNNDEKVKVLETTKTESQPITFSPQVSVNLGGITIQKEQDIEKTAEIIKQKFISEITTHFQTTK